MMSGHILASLLKKKKFCAIQLFWHVHISCNSSINLRLPFLHVSKSHTSRYGMEEQLFSFSFKTFIDLHNSTLIKAITRKIIPYILELFIEHVQTLTSRDSIKKEKSQVILVNMFYFPSHLHFQSTK